VGTSNLTSSVSVMNHVSHPYVRTDFNTTFHITLILPRLHHHTTGCLQQFSHPDLPKFTLSSLSQGTTVTFSILYLYTKTSISVQNSSSASYYIHFQLYIPSSSSSSLSNTFLASQQSSRVPKQYQALLIHCSTQNFLTIWHY